MRVFLSYAEPFLQGSKTKTKKSVVKCYKTSAGDKESAMLPPCVIWPEKDWDLLSTGIPGTCRLDELDTLHRWAPDRPDLARQTTY